MKLSSLKSCFRFCQGNRKVLIISFGVLWGSFFTLYYDLIGKLIDDWLNDPNYSHGFIIPFIALYMVWLRREKILSTNCAPSNLGLAVLILSLLIFIIGTLGSELFTMRLSMIFVVWSLVLFFFGVNQAKLLTLPILYLIFMIPIPAIVWNKISFPLKLFVSKLAVVLVAFFGVPVLRAGNIINLSTVSLQVVDACSGMRSLISLLSISAALAIVNDFSLTKKWLIFLSAIPFAIFFNVLRLFSTALLAQYYDPGFAKGFLHEISGIMVFGMAIVCMFFLNSLLKPSSKMANEGK